MNNTMPRTPFSTALSGSAKETEIRLKNIFSGPKKRPPLLFLVLIFSICVFCGNLVSCQVAGAEEEKPSVPALEDNNTTGVSARQPEDWQSIPLTAVITVQCPLDNPLAQEEIDLLEGLPADELPRQAVDPYTALRQDYWHDMLLPVAYDEEADMTIYFVVDPDSMTNMEPEANPDLVSLTRRGILLRLKDCIGYYNLNWDINAKFGSAPLAVVDDFDGDSRPEAALVLAWGEGTGCYAESLFIIDLDWNAMFYSFPHFSNIPLEITCNPEKTTALLSSGDQKLEVDLTQLWEPFEGEVYAGDQIRFFIRDDCLICRLGLNFSGRTTEYLASADFPIVFEDNVYQLGPAAALNGEL